MRENGSSMLRDRSVPGDCEVVGYADGLGMVDPAAGGAFLPPVIRMAEELGARRRYSGTPRRWQQCCEG